MTPEAKSFVAKGGTELTFLFTHEAMIAAEDCADAAFDKIVAGAFDGRIGHVRALVYGGLKEHHPNISRLEAMALIEAEGKELAQAMFDALVSAMPKPEDGVRPPVAGGTNRSRGTGTRSSPHGSKRASTKRASGSKRPAATR